MVTEKPEISLIHKNAMKKSKKKNQNAFTVIHDFRTQNDVTSVPRSAIYTIIRTGRSAQTQKMVPGFRNCSFVPIDIILQWLILTIIRCNLHSVFVVNGNETGYIPKNRRTEEDK